MHSRDLLMWWLREQQLLKEQELKRPVLYAAPPVSVPVAEYDTPEEEKESPRVIIIDL